MAGRLLISIGPVPYLSLPPASETQTATREVLFYLIPVRGLMVAVSQYWWRKRTLDTAGPPRPAASPTRLSLLQPLTVNSLFTCYTSSAGGSVFARKCWLLGCVAHTRSFSDCKDGKIRRVYMGRRSPTAGYTPRHQGIYLDPGLL